jgi:hypothetical protein
LVRATPVGSGLDWDDPPSRTSLEFFVQAIGGHVKVKELTAVDDQVFVLERVGLPDVRVWVCDVYTLGVADYMAIRERDPSIDCVVTMSGYNQYTPQTKAQGLAEGVGVFKFAELMGALHRDGEDFVAYKPPKKN